MWDSKEFVYLCKISKQVYVYAKWILTLILGFGATGFLIKENVLITKINVYPSNKISSTAKNP